MRVYYVHNGYCVVHMGSKGSCKQYIDNVKKLQVCDDNELQLCIHDGNRYRPVLETLNS